jgi:DivIVA domain-containing protein
VRDVYRQDLPGDRPLDAADIQRLRFGTALRGYAMGQVDDVLDRLAREISQRDALIKDLRAMAGVPDGQTSVDQVDAGVAQTGAPQPGSSPISASLSGSSLAGGLESGSSQPGSAQGVVTHPGCAGPGSTESGSTEAEPMVVDPGLPSEVSTDLR